MKTSELQGAALDWAVAKCEGEKVESFGRFGVAVIAKREMYSPSSNWSQGGPIIEREKIAHWPDEEGGWLASANEGRGIDFHGPTPLVAAMRCYVVSKLGDEVDIPEGLV